MSIPRPGTGRLTLALLAVAPAVLAYPWQSPRDYWLLGIAAAVVVLLFGWWRGLYFTTILCRGLAILGRRRRRVPESGTDTRTTALLRVGPPTSDRGVLPLPLIARYLDCYGIRLDKIRITSRATGADEPQTWIGLTVAATDNLAALQARSSRIPLHETAQVAARRLTDHLREIGWDASTVAPEDIPELIGEESRETWNGVRQGDSDYVAAYRIGAGASLLETLNAIRSHPTRETWTVLEIAGAPPHYTVAAACAFRTDTRPRGGAPLDGLTSQRGNQLPALLALDPVATQRLDGHTDAPADLLTGLNWPAPAALSRT
ncbi:type VII secretion protein EccE [Mycobacterium riyadhense]|uniref:type VII secretion protein EccE n=1 Tax=Mycobacterium riyadhense TaxID=486698 RepID=UPI001959FBE9|nr:type VII secretion protein EccE [Mycobacterium riyadhense]